MKAKTFVILIITLFLTSCTSKIETNEPKLSTPEPTPTPYIDSPKTIGGSPAPETTTWKSYTSPTGNYSIKYPTDYKLYENQVVSADGVLTQAKDTIQLISDPIPPEKTRFALSMYHARTTKESIQDIKNELSDCDYITSHSGGQATLNGKQGLIFVDTPCSYSGITSLYMLNKPFAYRINIESTTPYEEIRTEAEKVLSTIEFK